ncbi:hypothetical protein N665_0841s0012 [Sinapis alba]|nr:hypothetical protein N665_0841s0012 [Sinapis alba]
MEFSSCPNFVDMLNSQQNVFGNVSDSVSLSSSQLSYEEDTQSSRTERRTWTSTDDVVLISSWLNTSKDPLVGNEQKSFAFWKRITAYFSASPKLVGCEKREATHCKNRWQKINDLVCKFCGAYEAAQREKTSGQNENDVIKQHCWKELCTDQKWCELSTAKKEASSKKRKCGDGSQSASSQVNQNEAAVDDDGTNRPPVVKAAKARLKKPLDEGKDLSDFQSMWSIKKADLAIKERLSKMKILESLVAKEVPLADYEEDLKKKLINELMCT